MQTFLGGVRQAASSIYKGYFSLPHAASAQDVCARFPAAALGSTTLDLGSGKTPRNPFKASELYGIDVDYGIDELKKIVACDLGIEPIPFPDEFFDFVTAFDLLEHIPRLVYVGTDRRYPFIFLMSECFRVLKKGGLFLSDTPCFPRASTYIDPTHVNVITIDTFPFYFSRPKNWASRYGFSGDFELRYQAWVNQNLVTVLQRPA